MENGAHLIEHSCANPFEPPRVFRISTHYLLRLQPSKTDYYSTTALYTTPYSRVPRPFSSSLRSHSPSPRPLGAAIPQLQSKRIYNKECTRFVLHSPCAGSERATDGVSLGERSALIVTQPTANPMLPASLCYPPQVCL